MKAYIKLSEIYQRIEDDKKAFRAVQNARKFLEKLPEDHDQLQTLNDACENQQTIVLNNGPVISIDPEVYEKPTDSKKFNLNESVKRLHNGVGARKRGNHFDCVPNGVFVRENPFVRERLYKYAKSGSDVKNMDIMMERLHHGRKEIDQELIIHDQPFKNYTREGNRNPKINQHRLPPSQPLRLQACGLPQVLNWQQSVLQRRSGKG